MATFFAHIIYTPDGLAYIAKYLKGHYIYMYRENLLICSGILFQSQSVSH